LKQVLNTVVGTVVDKFTNVRVVFLAHVIIEDTNASETIQRAIPQVKLVVPEGVAFDRVRERGDLGDQVATVTFKVVLHDLGGGVTTVPAGAIGIHTIGSSEV